jgi:CRP/FNR family transcriptional activator FtrB
MFDDPRTTFASVPILSHLTMAERAQLSGCSYVQTFPPETTLFSRGQEVSFLVLVLDGELEIGDDVDGKLHALMLKTRGCVCPLECTLEGVRASYSARTMTKSRIIMIPVAFVRQLLASNAAFARDLLRHATNVSTRLMQALHDQQLRSPLERLANWIWRQVGDQASEGKVALHFSKRLLASILGMSLTTLGREIDALKAHGVTFKDRMIHVRNVETLGKLANPTPHLTF